LSKKIDSYGKGVRSGRIRKLAAVLGACVVRAGYLPR
jgi:hypothetical protein